jgi:hypothetical protein
MTLAGRHYNSASTRFDNGYVSANNCLNLVTLVPGNTYTVDLAPLGVNFEQLRAWIDFNNNGSFDNATEQVFFQNDIGPPAAYTMSTSGSFTVPAGAPVNTMVRMRVIEEVSTRYGAAYAIGNACYNPVYGQAEDYPIWLSAAIVLPVTYRYFRAQPAGNNVDVSWETDTESGSSHFVIERAPDGRNFVPVGHVVAKGRAASYRFTDPEPGQGNWYYRLRQVDADGGAAYTRTVQVQLGAPAGPAFALQSNIVRNEIRVRFDRRVASRQLRLLDLSGRVLLHKTIDPSAGQTASILFSGLHMPAGIYLLEIIDGPERQVEKIVRE